MNPKNAHLPDQQVTISDMAKPFQISVSEASFHLTGHFSETHSDDQVNLRHSFEVLARAARGTNISKIALHFERIVLLPDIRGYTFEYASEILQTHGALPLRMHKLIDLCGGQPHSRQYTLEQDDLNTMLANLAEQPEHSNKIFIFHQFPYSY